MNSGTLVFQHGETEKTISVAIIQKDDDVERDELFGVQLYNITPAGAQLSKKDFILCHIVTDASAVLQQAILA